LSPAPLALVEEPLHQGAIGIWRVAVAALGVPVMPFFVVALWMCQPQVQQRAGAAQAAWEDMLDGGSEAGLRVEAEAAPTDKTLAYPEAIVVGEGGVGGGNLVFLTGRHNSLAYGAAL
jgi:hypothetical protein